MKKYEDSELKYSATAKCICGSGLAYPRDGSQPEKSSVFKMASDWWCSKILKGEDLGEEGDPQHQIFPFSMYEIKSEDQPSANGMSTRPKEVGQ